MTFALGIAFAICAACTNCCIDSTRKLASSRIPAPTLVALPALFEAIIAPCVIAWFGGFSGVQFSQPLQFLIVVLASSALLLYSKLLYQRALASAPLSLTVPYLSFTPAILVAIAFLFLGETPSPTGCVGVVIITLGGFLLSRKNTSTLIAAKSQDHDKDSCSNSSSATNKDTPISTTVVVTASSQRLVATETGSNGDAAMAMQLSSARSRSFPSLVDVESQGSGGVPNQSEGSRKHAGPPQHASNGKGPPGAAAHSLAGRSSRAAAAAAEGSWPAPRPPLPTKPARSTLDWVPRDALQRQASQSRLGAGLMQPDQATAGVAVASAYRSLMQQPASLMMIGVACLWSVTASLDKLGVMLSPSIWVYIASQRVCIALISNAALALTSPTSYTHLLSSPLTLLLICMLELMAVVSFFMALKHLFVSYVVAIKRCNILLSVLVGGYFFKESILSRLPYICLMLAGMSLLVLEPNAGTIHHTSHSSHTK